MVENAILLERVTHELSGDMTHDPTKIQNLPKIDDLTQFRNFSKGYQRMVTNAILLERVFT